MNESFPEKKRRVIQQYRKPFLVLYLYALIIYLPLLVLRLTNDIDGLWNQDDYVAGTWELSIGRWFWPWLDRARFGISLDPLPGVFALALYVIGFLLILKILGYRPDGMVSYLSGFLFLASTAITCQMSHGYMVITFAVSFVLAVGAVAVLMPSESARAFSEEYDVGGEGRKEGVISGEMPSGCDKQNGNPGSSMGSFWQRRRFRQVLLRVLLSAILIALMMGCYQAGIGTTCLVALFLFMRILAGERNPERRTDPSGKREERPEGRNGLSEAMFFVLRMLVSILIGAVLYEILLHLHLAAFHITLSSYQGFSEIGPAYFLHHFGQGVRHAYQEIYYLLFTNVFQLNHLQLHRWFRVVYAVPLIPCVREMIRPFRPAHGHAGGNRDVRSGRKILCVVLYVASILLIPLFAGSFYLLAPEAETHMQMLLPYSLIQPLLLCGWNDMGIGEFRNGTEMGLSDKGISALRLCFLVGSFLLVYGAVGMNETDQYAMYAGRRSTAAIAENILNAAEALGQDPVNGQFEIIGVPAQSPLFSVKDPYYRANDYAQYGNWSEDVSFARVSWNAMYRNYLRTNVSLATGDTETTIAALPEVAAMAVFPTAGSIQNLYGVTVIKIAE